MDSAIDTLSTTSEHSIASSSESITAMQTSSKRSSNSPSNYSSNHTGGNSNISNNSHSSLNLHQRPTISSLGTGITGSIPPTASTTPTIMQHHHSQNSNSGTPNTNSGGGGSGSGSLSNRNDRDPGRESHHSGASSHHRRSLSPGSSPPPPSLPSLRSGGTIALSGTGGLGGGSSGHPPSPPSSAAALSHQQMMQQMQHQLSPPHVSTPNSLGAQMGPRGMPHLPPHSLGLLNSLQMMHHASPLELMAAAHHHVPPRSYNSPPPISTSDPTANECKLVEYRGQKVAAFIISGDTMLCLPQAFELFLKHLVGGLHTVYTKLKRLDIVPLVCNVEQVRILRGLGAIQPGVNRCKLLSCKDFDILYRDCTTARCLSIKPPERPGRPPKRGPVGLSLPPTHLSGHPQLKKHRLDNGDYAYENGHISDIARMDKSPLLANGYNPPPINHMAFMQMNHHPGSALMNPALPPHGLHRPDGSMMKAAAQAAGAAGMSAAGMDAIARSGIWENCRAAYEDIVKHLERNYRLREERTDDGRPPSVNDQKPRDLSSRNGSPNRQSPVLNLSKNGADPDDNISNCGDDRSDRSDGQHSPLPAPSVREDEADNITDDNVSEDDGRIDKDDDLSDTEERELNQPPATIPPLPPVNTSSAEQAALAAAAHHRAINYSSLAAASAVAAAANNPNNSIPLPNDIDHPDQQGASSTETLLRNIQSLLKVAADNARQQERQITYEKAELKMDVLREREVKDSLERQLVEERKLRVLYQKRYRRERKLRIRLQQRIEGKRKGSNNDGSSEQNKNSQDAEGDKTNNCGEKSDKISHSSSSSSSNNHDNKNQHRRSSESPSNLSLNHQRDNLSDRNSNDRENRDRRDRDDRNSSCNTTTGTTTTNTTSNIDRDGINNNNNNNNNNSNHRPSSVGGPHDINAIGSGNGASGSTAGNPNISGNGSINSANNNGKSWNYPGIDLMTTGAFWQNYSESLAQEIEMERKARQQNSERDVKSPLQDRQPGYYKNPVLFGSAT
ncbi:arginine/serine-rich protein PNISR [Condylostylus longicornis]|uniref:arginine/serine-rich protein PNISR n=1 Tax=Condylostylus longicornis TaxID=2530218 RepID=UPI00244D9ADB|nr:arginine/serine-rich protein PNISR [Condylostylus longicornis]